MMSTKKYAAAVAAIVVGVAGVTWGLAGCVNSSHTPCSDVTASPWIDTVGGQVYVCTTTGPVPTGPNDAQPVWHAPVAS